ncbi:MAG: N-acetylneuraminate synthase [Salinivirgaceae bacterium]|jgi:N,N'-diacetyllegionaminate synthase|nr:N-acetylneuraminate synthase [Salinivirgaceae bacterium]
MDKVIIIAEAGVNHNGNIDNAKRLIDIAADAGVDYVKFQTFKANKLASKKASKAKYQKVNTGNNLSQFEMLKKLELSESDHNILITHCVQRNIKFLSTGFDNDSINFLSKGLIDFIKIPSGEITNYPYLVNCALKKLPIILSTGMCYLDEVGAALNVLVKNGADRKSITILHCNTEYPTPISDVNLLAMQTLNKEFGVKVGYSDHTLGIEVPIAAVAMGASVIEKHFTLDRNMNGPDHKASLEPSELKAMVTAIRNVERALGTGIKEPSESEKKNIFIARKSIHINQIINPNSVLNEDMLIMKRPGDGISPMELNKIIGRRTNKLMNEDDKLSWEDLI